MYFLAIGLKIANIIKKEDCIHELQAIIFRERLNVGSLPTVKMHPVGSLPTVKMHPVGSLPTVKMHPLGSLPTVKMHPIGSLPWMKF